MSNPPIAEPEPPEFEGQDDWPDCAIEGCPRKSCRALDSIYCFPHTDGNQHVKRWKINARNAGCENETAPVVPYGTPNPSHGTGTKAVDPQKSAT